MASNIVALESSRWLRTSSCLARILSVESAVSLPQDADEVEVPPAACANAIQRVTSRFSGLTKVAYILQYTTIYYNMLQYATIY